MTQPRDHRGDDSGGQNSQVGKARTIDSSATRGLLVALASLILLTWLLPGGTGISRPWLVAGTLATTALACTGAGLGIRALARRGQTGMATPGAIPAIVTGAVTAVLALFLLLSVVLLWEAFGELERCRSRALVNSAESACLDDFTEDTERRFGRPLG